MQLNLERVMGISICSQAHKCFKLIRSNKLKPAWLIVRFIRLSEPFGFSFPFTQKFHHTPSEYCVILERVMGI